MNNSTINKCIASDYVLIFNNLLDKYQLSQSEAARLSGLNQPTVNRFCSGRDIVISNYYQLISSMPFDFQREYWGALLKDTREVQVDDWFMRISTASRSDMKKIVLALAQRFLEVERND